MLSKQEKQIFKKGFKTIAGIDEVGRGCLAGPVAAASVVIKKPINGLKNVRDSKALTEKQREEIFEKAKNHPNIEWAVSYVQPKIIDKININKATILAWKKCLEKLKQKPDFLFLDGNQEAAGLKIPQQAVIKGDQKIFVLSLASIMAKVSRDRLMKKMDKKYPQYQLSAHKGYGTKMHFEKLKKHKPANIHRCSFSPVFANLSFKEKVYYCVSQIPRGQTMSYKQVAQSIGHPRAFRAVGSALNRNQDSKIPCHRVIRSSGQIGEYNKGKRNKARLLAAEKKAL